MEQGHKLKQKPSKYVCISLTDVFTINFYAFTFRCLRHNVFRLSTGLSILPSVQSLKYPLSTCTSVCWSIKPTVTVFQPVFPSVCPDRFPAISRRMSEILHADVSWPLSELITLWVRSADFSYFGTILTQWNGSNLWFLGISQRTHGGNSLKFCMLMYPDHFQNWLDFGHGLFIFLLLTSPWLSEMS